MTTRSGCAALISSGTAAVGAARSITMPRNPGDGHTSAAAGKRRKKVDSIIRFMKLTRTIEKFMRLSRWRGGGHASGVNDDELL